MTDQSQPLIVIIMRLPSGTFSAEASEHKHPLVYAPTRERVLEMAERAFAPYAAGRPIEIRDAEDGGDL